MTDCTCDTEVTITQGTDAVVTVPGPSPVILLSGSAPQVEVALNGYTIIVDGIPEDEVVEVMTKTKGDKGDKGDAGPRGIRGDRGVPGPEGLRGRDGEQGIRGFRGPQGEGGGQGPAGSAGPPGEIDSELLLELVQPMLNEAALIPIAELREDLEALPQNVLASFLGDVSGGDITDMTWSAGSDGESYVGTVSTLSMISDKDYMSIKTTTGLVAKVSNSMAAIRIEQQVIAEQAYATANQLTTFVAQVGSNIAAITEQLTATSSQAYATASIVESISAVTEESFAALQNQLTVLTDEYSATVEQLTNYIASNDENVALVQSTLSAQADSISAVIHTTETLSTTVGDQAGQISELYDLVNDAGTGEISANYQFKMEVTDGDQVVTTGVALGASIGQDDSYKSEIIFMADTVGFLTQNGGTLHQPFIFDVLHDTVYLAAAFIDAATITSAMIADYIQSDDYVSATSGWRISRSTGAFEMNGSESGGGRIVMTNTGVKVYDAADTLRVELGKLA